MAKATRIKAKNLMLFLSDQVICLSTSCSLDVTGNYTKVASKDSGKWDDMDLDSIAYSGSNESFITEKPNDTALGYKECMEKLLAGESVPMAFGLPANKTEDDLPEGGWTKPTANYYSGTVKITKVSMSAPESGNASLNISFEGCGPLEFKAGA